MKITCQSCQSKYTVSDEKVQGKTVKIKCRKCGATILVNSSGATTTNAADASAAGAEEASATDGGSFQVNVGEGDQRTMSLQEVVQAYNSSVITADTYVWADGMGDWQPLGQVQAIVDALNAAASGASAPEPAPEPARAAVKKDAGRGARDLFGSDGASAEVATSASSFGGPSPARSAPARIGAGKEEQSALFSLSALTNRAGTSGSSSAASSLGGLGALASTPSKPSNTDDSGLIDLKALAAGASAAPSTAAASLLGDTGGLFELGAPPVTAPAAPATPTFEETKPQKNRTPLFIGVGALVAVGAIVGAFMVMKGGPPPEPTATSAAPANTPPPLDTAPPAPTPSVAETEAPAASASAVAAKGTTKTGGTTKASGGTTTKAGTAPTSGGGTAPASTAKTSPKPSSCGCAPGDLMCAMRCSAKGK